MKLHNLKQSLLQSLNSCRNAICNAAAKTSVKTRALPGNWKRTVFLLCAASSITAAGVLGAGAANQAYADVTYKYTGNTFDPSLCDDRPPDFICGSGKITAEATFDNTVTSEFTGKISLDLGVHSLSGVLSCSISAFGRTDTHFWDDNLSVAWPDHYGFGCHFRIEKGKIAGWELIIHETKIDESHFDVESIADFTSIGFASDYVESIDLKQRTGMICMNRYLPGTWTQTTAPKNCGNPPCPRAMAGNPINTATGNKLQTETDFVGAPSTHLVLQRTFNSQDSGSTPFGANWRSTWHSSISQTSSTSVKVTRADGRVDTFTLTSGAWTSDVDVTSKLNAVTDGGWKLVTPDDSTELYSSDGRLISITTRAGLATTLAYDASNRLTTVTGPFGHTLSFTYDTAGRVAQVTAPDATHYLYGYDANGNLTTVTYPDNAVRQYLYENTSFPRALTGIIDENGDRFATYAYDGQGRAISSEHAGGAELTTITYNSDGSAAVTDANGNSHSYNFTTQFDLVKPTSMTNKGCSGCGSSAYTYDANGFLASRTDFNGNITTYTRDARGLELSRTEASGTAQARTITTTWHGAFHLPTQITEPNRVTTFIYDATGNLLQKTVTAGSKTRTWAYTYNGSGQVLTVNGPRTDLQDVTSFSYDAKGNVATVTDALGHVTSISQYDANGRPLSITDPNGLVTTLGYDARGRLTSRTVGAEVTTYTYDAVGQLTKITLPDGSYLTYSYDKAHRLIGIADALGNRIAFTLDAVGNRVKEEVFDPGSVLTQTRSHVYDTLNRMAQDIGAQNQATIYDYDNNGNLSSVNDPLNHKTDNAYDALNRLIQVTDPKSGVTSFGYDANDRTTSVTDPRGLATAYAYNGLDDLTSTQSPDTGTSAQTFDAAGNVLSSTDARGKKTTFAYDALNRLTTVGFADGKSVAYQYDQGTNGIGRLTKMTDPSGSTAWSYNSHGRVVQKQQKTGSVTLTTTTTYDAAGRIASVTYPSGRELTYTYDQSGHLSAVYVDGTVLVNNADYEPFGPLAMWLAGNGAAYSRSFDLDGRLAGITIGGSSGGVINLAYDAAGRITGISDTGGSRPSLGTGTTSYQYAAASNRLLKTTGMVSENYTYDAAGNLTGVGTDSLVYDARGRLAQVTSGGVVTQYAINGFGQRVTKSGSRVASGAVHFFYDEAGLLVGEYDAAGNVIQETAWFNDMPVGVLKAGTQYYVNPDHLGAPKSITDQSGNLVWKWDRDPFGNGLPDETPTGGSAFVYNLRFPGQYYDSETGLHYNMARDYDPALGRYIQSDPIGVNGGVNTYAYAGVDPVTRVDPTGTEGFPFEQEVKQAQPIISGPPSPGKERLLSHSDELHSALNSLPDNLGKDLFQLKLWWNGKSCIYKCNVIPQPICWAVGAGASYISRNMVAAPVASSVCITVKFLVCKWICEDEPEPCENNLKR